MTITDGNASVSFILAVNGERSLLEITWSLFNHNLKINFETISLEHMISYDISPTKKVLSMDCVFQNLPS